MAGSFALTMRRESTITAGIKDNAAAAAAAEAGIAYAEMMLLSTDQNKRWRADGNIYQVDFGDTQVRLRLISEAGKININKANLALLQSLMAQSPVDEDRQPKIIGAIMDWRDPDDLLNIDGAEKREYRKAGLKYQPRNKPFQTMEELQMVLGMDDRLYNWLEPVITVYSSQAQVNLKQATTKVLNLLPGLDAGLIETYVASRLESAKTEQPAPEFPSTLLKSGGSVAGGNETVTIISEARMQDETSAVISAIVAKSGGNQVFAADASQTSAFKILKWRRNPAHQEPLFSDEMSELLVKEYAEPELID
ncbi:MAG: general secretion pathway protein GspK [Methylococcaceae bacterium]|nr:general secretion pathway protein GspK [Methylococcaceae bacterium]